MTTLTCRAPLRAEGGSGAIYGVANDPFGGELDTLDCNEILSVDIFNLATAARSVTWISGSADSDFRFGGLAPGNYKLRFRFWDEDSHLPRNRWSGNAGSFTAATEIAVVAGAAFNEASPAADEGSEGVGHAGGARLGAAPDTACHVIHLFEAGDVGMGWTTSTDGSGHWKSPRCRSADGPRWGNRTGVFDPDGDMGPEPPLDCGTSPAPLDTGYRGPRGGRSTRASSPTHTPSTSRTPSW